MAGGGASSGASHTGGGAASSALRNPPLRSFAFAPNGTAHKGSDQPDSRV